MADPHSNLVSEIVTLDRRLVISRILKAAEGASATIAEIQTALADCGHAHDTATVVGDLAWLEVKGMVRISANGRRVEAVTAGAAKPPVPKLTEDLPDQQEEQPGRKRGDATA